MATNNVSVNYDDERLTQVERDEQVAQAENKQLYDGMIENSDQYYQAQIDASKEWADTQAKNQQDRTDFTIEQIEQQKDQAHKDYLKEQSGAYVDWQKQTSQHGVNAEQMAAAGLAGTGFSESSLVSMYNTYQNRVTTARESYNQAVLNYNNAIKDAQLQNNSILAEIAYNSFKTQLELSLQGFQYKNNLIMEQANKKIEIDNMYYNRYRDEVNQINTENAAAQQAYQFEKSMEFEAEQARLDREFQAKQAEIDRVFEREMAAISRQHDKDMLAAETQAEKELADKKYEQDMAKLAKQHEYDKAILDKQLANDKALLKAQASSSGGGYTSSKSSGTTSGGVKAAAAKASGKTQTYEVNTEYYQGSLNPDAKNGVMSNGYQPDNINGKKVSKTGQSISISTVTRSGEKRTVTQNVWKTPDGKLWYWEGRQNKYIQINTGSSGGGGGSTNTYKVIK